MARRRHHRGRRNPGLSLSNPLVLIGGGVAAWYLLKGKKKG